MNPDAIDRWNRCPYYQLLGMAIRSAGDGGAVLDLRAGPSLHQAYGTVHGGAIAGLVDAAMGIAIISALGPEEGCATIEMKLNYTAPATAGTIRAEGEVLSLGRRLVTARAEARDAEGRLVSAGQGTFQRFTP